MKGPAAAWELEVGVPAVMDDFGRELPGESEKPRRGT